MAEDVTIESIGASIKTAIEEQASISSQDLLPLDYQPRTFKNIIDWVSSPDGLNLPTVFKFVRQYQFLRDFYGLLCPQCNPAGPERPLCIVCEPLERGGEKLIGPLTRFDCWDKRPEELATQVLFEDRDGIMICPNCNMLQTESGWPAFNTLIGDAGMRSGKSATAACACTYELHKDLLLENPQKTWGLLPGQEVRYTIAATTEEQAKDTTFSQVDGLLQSAPWFVAYIAALKRAAKKNHKPVDAVYASGATEIKFLHKQLFIDLVGSNSAGAAGRTRRMVVIDEIARFVTGTTSRLSVDQVYDTLLASLLTLAKYGSKMICISSPQYKGDKIFELHDKARTDIIENGYSSTLTFHLPTWFMNPELPREHPFIEKQFKENPVQARRDFGAEHPGALTPFIEHERYVDACVDPDQPCLVLNTRDMHRTVAVKNKVTRLLWKDTAKCVLDITATRTILIACDPGHLQDSFGMVLAYVKPIRTSSGVEEHIFIGSVLEWKPDPRAGVEVDFRNVLDCIQRFKKHWILDKVVYDQWQTVTQIQDLRDLGVDAEKQPLNKNDWETFAALIYNRNLHLLSPERGGPAAAKLITEIKNLESRNGKVDHSVHSSSDLAVCAARAVKMLVSPEVQEVRAISHASRGFGRLVRLRRP